MARQVTLSPFYRLEVITGLYSANDLVARLQARGESWYVFAGHLVALLRARGVGCHLFHSFRQAQMAFP